MDAIFFRKIIILLLSILAINLSAQTPRINFRQVIKDTITGSILLSGADSSMVYSRDFYISADSSLILYGDTVGNLSSILVDGITILGDGINTNLSVDTNLIKDIIGAMVNAGLGIDVSYDIVDKELLIESLSIEDLVHNGTGTQIDKGTPLYVVGVQGNYWSVAPADAADISKLPVVAIAGENIADGTEGLALIKGHIKGVNTSAFTAGDEVYVAVGGGYTNVKPKGESNYVQYLGTVIKADANGSGIINLGEVESNLNPGRIFIGAADSTITRVTLNDSISAIVGDSLNSNVVRSITAGTFLSGGTITTSGTIALDTASAGLKTYISDNSAGGTTFNNLSETADTIFVSKFLNVDTATLYVDAVNNRVGIGTSSPANTLHVQGKLLVDATSMPSVASMHLGQWVGIPNSIFDHSSIKGDLFIGNVGANTARLRVTSNANQGFVSMNEYYDPLLQDSKSLDSTKSTYIINMQIIGASSNTDYFEISRSYTGTSTINYSPLFRITGAGNVGIGTSSPTEKLDVNGNARFRSIGSGASAGALHYTSTGVLTTNTSDVRLKTNLQPLENTLNKLLSINTYTFNWIDETDRVDLGMVAQEVEQIFPNLVFTNNVDGYKGIHYDKFSSILTKAIQEQQAIIETQQAEIETLKTQYNDLLQRIINLENK